MRKSIIKRVKFTQTGKLLYRKSGLNHFNAKASRKVQLRQKKTIQFSKAIEKRVKQYL